MLFSDEPLGEHDFKFGDYSDDGEVIEVSRGPYLVRMAGEVVDGNFVIHERYILTTRKVPLSEYRPLARPEAFFDSGLLPDSDSPIDEIEVTEGADLKEQIKEVV